MLTKAMPVLPGRRRRRLYHSIPSHSCQFILTLCLSLFYPPNRSNIRRTAARVSATASRARAATSSVAVVVAVFSTTRSHGATVSARRAPAVARGAVSFFDDTRRARAIFRVFSAEVVVYPEGHQLCTHVSLCLAARVFKGRNLRMTRRRG